MDLRGWDVTPNPEDKKAKKLKTNVCVQLDKGGELACSGIIAPSDRHALSRPPWACAFRQATEPAACIAQDDGGVARNRGRRWWS
eukprot:COSAG04_NODE_10_length_43369_cov_4.059025_36_plen_85_part_00